MVDKAAESVEWFKKAVDLAPLSVGFINDYAVTLMRVGKLDEADTELKKGLKLEPDHPDLLANLGAVAEHIEFRERGVLPEHLRGEVEEEEDDGGVWQPGLFRNPDASPGVTKGKGKGRRKKRQEADDSHHGGSAVPSYDDVPAGPDPVKAAKKRDEALDYAISDQLAMALPLFEMAVELDPDNGYYLSDLGVTYMRLHFLDKAQQSFKKAKRLLPDDQSIKDNLKALQEHLNHRVNVARDRDAEDFAESILEVPLDEAVASQRKFASAGTYDDGDDKEKPEPAGAKIDPASGGQAFDTSSMSGGWFGQWFFNSTLKTLISEQIQSGKPVQIKNVFRADFAEKLWSEMDSTTSWQEYSGYEEWYQFALHAIYMDMPGWSEMQAAKGLHAFLNTDEVKGWASDVTASKVDGPTSAGMSHYMAGDYTMAHTDFSEQRKKKRRLAYIVHMTKNFNFDYGGDLIFLNPVYHMHPEFNSMTIFSVEQDSWHFVSPVASTCPKDQKRLAYSGWFTSGDLSDINKRFTVDENAHRMRDFCLLVDGETSSLIDFVPYS